MSALPPSPHIGVQVLYELGRHFRLVILRLLQVPIVFVLPLGSGSIVTVFQCLFQLMASIFKVSLNFLRVRAPFFVIFVFHAVQLPRQDVPERPGLAAGASLGASLYGASQLGQMIFFRLRS